jgi:enamine deaminase RidA (YjgF/YER057c/UK114 family)
MGPYSQAIITSPLIFVSGQIPADSQGNLVEGSITDKTAMCAQNVKAILEEAGSSIEKVVKTTVGILLPILHSLPTHEA